MSPLAPIGALRHRLRLERSSLAADGSTLWTLLDTVSAALRPHGATATEAGAGITGRLATTIEIRWRADVDAACRLVLGARVFRVRAAWDPDERRARLRIEAEEEEK